MLLAAVLDPLTSLHFQDLYADSITNILSGNPIDITGFAKTFILIVIRIFLATVSLTSLDLQNLHADSISNILSSSPPNSIFKIFMLTLFYLLTNWLAYLYGRIQSPRPDVMLDRREGITRAAGFVFACIDTQAS